MLTKPLADKTRMLKETPEGVDTMCKAIEENNKRIDIEPVVFSENSEFSQNRNSVPE